MTETEMKQFFGIMQLVYPASELFQGDVAGRVKIWAGFFKDVELRRMKEALTRYVQRNKFAPSIAELMDELKTDVVKRINTAAEWDELLVLCQQINNLRCDFGYTYIPPGAMLSQGEQAKEDARRLYDNAPRYLKTFLGTYSAALQYAYEIERLDSTGLSIRRRDYEQRRKDDIADSTVGELEDSLLTDGLTRRVIGYDHYMPIYEEE